MNFEFQKFVMQILTFLLMFMIAKGWHQDFYLLFIITPIIHNFFCER
jgi:hypothetical protein